ncbi:MULTISPECIES: alanine--tRNA ligase [Caproicibacterium]|uniref:Alanine--tRNA ligase n=1 Tax=Caproicibacterium argilliputei TaxID=3030016 RepID=A0AA97H2U5_9FIRM|nr:alanine--tRNA ligase [Caproicibacterium argilliputei]WOC33090.1 alanine--tRNA ligase [Caproicibacterium argilliputei]
MQWMGLNEIREKYLEFFEGKGHLRLPSFPLIPKDDNSLLLINSGMAPMKKYFTGEVTPPRKRVTTCQKCIRTGDIENVGITDRHGTFFEMLGNFSFGDYFKHEATAWAWEFCTKVMEMPVDKLWVTIYQDDDEAFEVWTKEVGVAADHIVRLGKEDNFWEHGPGPCGPCSEIYFDRGPEHGCGKPTCGVGCDCDRYVEFWNVVFSQFNSDGHGNYPPMEHPNIDTGMGLERLACVMQNVDNLFLVDTMQNIIKKVCTIAGTEYGKDKKKDISIRVITDHVRSVTFMIADGIMPSNNGRGYVLRRLLRRAARHGRLLGIDRSFLTEVAESVIHESCGAYPELTEKKEMIQKVISVEEESFAKTIDQGTAMLNEIMEHHEGTVISGEDAFKLSDTYGFPIDLTKEIAAENGMTVDEETYHQRMQEQRQTARAARKNAGAESWAGESDLLKGVPETEFLGYREQTAQAKVLAIIAGDARAESADAGDEIGLILDRTTFYGESGGQVGDTGTLSADDAVLAVSDTTKNHAKNFIHHCTVQAGTIRIGDSVTTQPDWKRRQAIMRNHTAAHLLQAALRRVLGTHVEQAGQLVNDRHVRFDFTHFAALTPEELRKVEEMVNEKILSAVPVESSEMPIEEAKKLGAMALFGEKYGKIVRVVSVDDFSKEFCGGTHMDNTAKLGLFKIVAESSVAAGVRRIEAVTGYGVYRLLNDSLQTIDQTAAALKSNTSADLVAHAEQTAAQLKQAESELEKLNAKLAGRQVEQLLAAAEQAGSVRVCTAKLNGADAGVLRTMCDKVRDQAPDMVAVFAGVNGAKANIAVAVGKDALAKGAHAGKIAKAVAQLAGGNGGGKPDFAMAGAKDLAKLDTALQAARGITAEFAK